MQGTAIRFLRDAAGKVTGLTAGDDRTWDLRFQRIKWKTGPCGPALLGHN